MAEKSRFFFEDFESYEEKAARKNLKASAEPALRALLEGLQAIPGTGWQAEPLHQCVLDVATRLDVKLGKVAQPLRVALSGGSVSPSIDQTLALLGRERALNRLQRAIDYIGEQA